MLHLSVVLHTIHFLKQSHIECNNILQCFKSMFHTIEAHEWINDAHVYEMQVKMWKPNTWGVIALPPIKNLVPRFDKHTIVDRIRYNLPLNNLLFPTLHRAHYPDYST